MRNSLSSRISGIFLICAIALTITGGLFTNTAFAAAPTMTAETADTDNDGTVDQITITFNEASDIIDGNAGNGLASIALSDGCTIPNGDYAADNVTTLVLSNLTGCTLGDTSITPTVTYTAVASCATENAICDDALANQMANSENTTSTDSAEPVLTAVTLSSASNRNRLAFTYTENVTVTNGASSATNGDVTTAGQIMGVGNFATSGDTTVATTKNTVGGNGTTIITIDLADQAAAYIDSISTTEPSGVFTPVATAAVVDANSNQVNTSATAPTAGSGSWDLAKPTIASITVNDAAGSNNGQIDQAVVVFSEAVRDANITDADADLGIVGTTTGTFTTGTANDATTTFNRTDDNAVDTSIAAGDFTYDGSTTLITDRAGNLLDTTTDGTIASGDNTETDGAAPIITDLLYYDNGNDGSVETLEVSFSENCVWNGNDLQQFMINNGGLTGFADTTAPDANEPESFDNAGNGTSTFTLTTEGTTDLTGVSGGTEPTTDYAQSMTLGDRIKDSANNDLVAMPMQTTIRDEASPILLSAETLSDRDIELVFSEAISGTGLAGGDIFLDSPGNYAMDSVGGGGTDTITWTTATPAEYWNTDATGSSAGTGTDATGVPRANVPNITFNAGVFTDTASPANGVVAVSISTMATDGAAPAVIYLGYEDDLVVNGTVDSLFVMFSEDLDDSFVPMVSSDFTVTINGGAGTMVETLDTDTADDDEIIINFTNGIANSTNEDYELAIAGSAVSDANGNLMSALGATDAADEAVPFLLSFTSAEADGTYGPGDTINLTATYTENIAAGSTITVDLNNTVGSEVLSSISSDTITKNYTVGATGSLQDVTGLDVSSITAHSATDATSNTNSGLGMPATTIITASSINVDTTADLQPGTPDLQTASDSGSSNSDNYTNDNTPTFDITCVAGSTVTLRIDTIDDNAGVCPGGGTVTITAGVIADASVNIDAYQTDAAGNDSPDSADLGVTIDTLAPAAPGAPDMTVGTDSGSSNSDDYTNDTTPTFDIAIVETNATVSLISSVNGAVGGGAEVVNAATITASAMTGGAGQVHSMTATQTDAAGNTSVASGALSITIDTVNPTFSSAIANADTNVLITMSETIGSVTFGAAADWTATGMTAIGTALNAGDIDLTVASLGDTAFTASDFAFAIANSGDIQDVAGNPAAPFSAATIADGQAPLFDSASVDDTDSDGTIDQVTILYSETISITDGNAGDAFPGLTLNNSCVIVNADYTAVGITTSVITLTGCAPGANSPTVTYATAGNSIYDASLEMPDGESVVAVDTSKPVPMTVSFEDEDEDGTLDLITVAWSKSILAVADGSADWALTSAADFAGIVEGTVECSSGSAAANECDYYFTTTTEKTDVGDLTLAYTGSSVSDGLNIADHVTFTASSTVPFTDAAAPVVKTTTITLYDIANDGFADRLIATYTEPLVDNADSAGDWAVNTNDHDSGGLCAVTVADPDGTNSLTIDITCDTTYGDVGDMSVVFTNGAFLEDATGNGVPSKTYTSASTPPIVNGITPGVLTSTNVEPASLNMGTSGTATVSFTTVKPIGIDGKIKVTFGAGYNVTGAAGGNCSTMDGTFVTTVSGQEVTLTRQSDGTSEPAGAQTCTIDTIVNPAAAGTTGTYDITTTYTDDVIIDQDSAVAADTIVDPTPPPASSGGSAGGRRVVTPTEEATTVTEEPLVFSDVVEHWAEEFIYEAKDAGYVEGYEDATFKPNQYITRAEASKLVAMWLDASIGEDACNADLFSDVDCTDWYAKYVTYLYNAEIIEGYGEGLFGPSKNINRAEALKMMLFAKAIQDSDVADVINPFSDVNTDQWFYNYVMVGYKLSIVQGYEDGTFGPGNNITRAEFTKIFVETLMNN